MNAHIATVRKITRKIKLFTEKTASFEARVFIHRSLESGPRRRAREPLSPLLDTGRWKPVVAHGTLVLSTCRVPKRHLGSRLKLGCAPGGRSVPLSDLTGSTEEDHVAASDQNLGISALERNFNNMEGPSCGSREKQAEMRNMT